VQSSTCDGTRIDGFDEVGYHCFFQRQPETKAELYHALCAERWSCVQCLRYGGDDPKILRRLADIGEPEACDNPVPVDAKPILRNYVSFDVANFFHPGVRLERLLGEAFRAFCLGLYVQPSEVSPLVQVGASLRFNHYNRAFTLSRSERDARRWLLHHADPNPKGTVAISVYLDEYMRGHNEIFRSLRWYSADEWKAPAAQGMETPY
jgi:hypothetical protein